MLHVRQLSVVVTAGTPVSPFSDSEILNTDQWQDDAGWSDAVGIVGGGEGGSTGPVHPRKAGRQVRMWAGVERDLRQKAREAQWEENGDGYEFVKQ